jgi:hypothetical protein
MSIIQPKGFKPKMREHKLRNGVNWHGASRQKGAKLTGAEQGLDVFESLDVKRENVKF